MTGLGALRNVCIWLGQEVTGLVWEVEYFGVTVVGSYVPMRNLPKTCRRLGHQHSQLFPHLADQHQSRRPGRLPAGQQNIYRNTGTSNPAPMPHRRSGQTRSCPCVSLNIPLMRSCMSLIDRPSFLAFLSMIWVSFHCSFIHIVYGLHLFQYSSKAWHISSVFASVSAFSRSSHSRTLVSLMENTN